MKVFAFHLMPYGALDMSYAEKHNSVWLKLPNSYFDPRIGHELYNRYLDELELCAELGFDGISVNEHHQNAYGLMPSPVVMAAALARNTENCKIAILGNAFALREHPLTLAEEHAMIDNITGGRLITGMVRGVGCEYFSMGVNPAYSLERHIEAHDLVVRAWTETGPFAFEGKHYHFEYVNMWPRPYQDPHPPIWCPSQGSTETIEWAAHPDRKYTYLQAYSAFESVLRYLNMYRSVAEVKYGYTASSNQIAWSVPVYCAQTDEQAVEEVRPHIEVFVQHVPAQDFPVDVRAAWLYDGVVDEEDLCPQGDPSGWPDGGGSDGARRDCRRQPGYGAQDTDQTSPPGRVRTRADHAAVRHAAVRPDRDEPAPARGGGRACAASAG